MDKFQNKYRIPSARLQTWDYRNSGAYFITICTKNRVHYFGEIVETDCNPSDSVIERINSGSNCNPSNTMQLNDVGKMVEIEWMKTIQLRPDMHLQLDAFVIMPNHFHAIIIIGDNQYNTGRDGLQSVSNGNNANKLQSIDKTNINNNTTDGLESVSMNNINNNTTDRLQSISMNNINDNKTDGLQSVSTCNVFGPQTKNLSSIIRGFKSAVTKNARQLNPDFEWQTRFHDHIIRDEKSFTTIRSYIYNNPKNWKEDTFYKS